MCTLVLHTPNPSGHKLGMPQYAIQSISQGPKCLCWLRTSLRSPEHKPSAIPTCAHRMELVLKFMTKQTCGFSMDKGCMPCHSPLRCNMGINAPAAKTFNRDRHQRQPKKTQATTKANTANMKTTLVSKCPLWNSVLWNPYAFIVQRDRRHGRSFFLESS
jgi:hypothetical protein